MIPRARTTNTHPESQGHAELVPGKVLQVAQCVIAKCPGANPRLGYCALSVRASMLTRRCRLLCGAAAVAGIELARHHNS